MSQLHRIRACSHLLFPLLLLTVSWALTGCVHDVIHQPTIAPLPTAKDVAFSTCQTPSAGEQPSCRLKLNSAATTAERRADNVHATVEFREDGEFLDPCQDKNGAPRFCQQTFAEAFVRAARQKIAQPDSRIESLVVIAFMHGNLNNASEDVDNYPHFRELLNCLNLGSEAYAAAFPKPYKWRNASGKEVEYKHPLDCSSVKPPGSIRYVGVYLGWRGRTNTLGLNVREGAARKITRGHGVRESLIGLRSAAKDNTTNKPARFIIAAHSFGGLIIERTMMQIYEAAYNTPNPVMVDCNSTTGPAKGLPPFTDMVVTINEAVNSIPAKHFIEDVLKPKHGQFCGSNELSPAMQRPILVALESKSDFWSAGKGTYLQHIGGPDDRHPGDFTDEQWYPDGRPSKWLAKVLTPPDNPYFQNVCYLQSGFTPGDPICDLQTRETQYIALEGLVMPKLVCPRENNVPACKYCAPSTDDKLHPLSHLYVRRGCRKQTSPVPLGEDVRNSWPCIGDHYSDDPSQLHVWNDTPYWIGAIDLNVINGHNGFWNMTFLGLLSGMVNAFSEPLTLDQVTR